MTSPLAGITVCSCTRCAPATQEASKAKKRQMVEIKTLTLGKMTTGSVMSD